MPLLTTTEKHKKVFLLFFVLLFMLSLAGLLFKFAFVEKIEIGIADNKIPSGVKAEEYCEKKAWFFEGHKIFQINPKGGKNCGGYEIYDHKNSTGIPQID